MGNPRTDGMVRPRQAGWPAKHLWKDMYLWQQGLRQGTGDQKQNLIPQR